MDVFAAIAKRHSYRGPYKPQPVPREDLRRIVQAGLQAPSGRNMQTTSFVIVDDPPLVRRIAALHATNTAVQQAQAFIACCVDRQPQPVYEGHHFQVEDCAAAVENMLLAITALGYASVWIDGWLRLENHAETIGNLLGLPPAKAVRILLPVGAPAETWPQKDKKPFEARTFFNRYGRHTASEPLSPRGEGQG
ncbi:MAG TPA: nitroreductase family protein [Phycisphaerae bacterium]|nr:nitroreductase family protein [Phycisphaerae bacterium]HNU45011.1 nitroreductase family protein [Phycisphaerae bacterium]